MIYLLILEFESGTRAPSSISHEVVRAHHLVAKHPKMAHHFHTPLQSGSTGFCGPCVSVQPRLLLGLVARIRVQVPDAAIGGRNG